jgi:hypothetical protein
MSSLMLLLPLEEKKLSEDVFFTRKNGSKTVESVAENQGESELVLFAPIPERKKDGVVAVAASKGTKRKAN